MSKINARGWCAFWDGRFTYGVREEITQTRFVVNLLERTCSCNEWKISGVPCNHAVAAIWSAKEQPEHYVATWFRKETYLKAYDFLMEPLNGPHEWPSSNNHNILAPPFKKLKNRPTTKKKKQVWEVTASGKMKKTGIQMTCSHCGSQGHNKRGCQLT
ncbi:uncharacterized protein LOC110697516 [Chenopodium quinoa]|uniref:uncharacterized protein LOC110697516 n=1 Tax=Chenopodium quinoa TaxID=63459 RepID=UPI000B76E0D7|nr:uncharacterized protein LOC110697516 [Chenopodium quinoa]